MALYAIGDLHLSLGTNKPMDVFGSKWANHVERIHENFSHLSDDDVIASAVLGTPDASPCHRRNRQA